MTISDAICGATEQLAHSGIQTARLDAEVLLAHIVKKDRAWLIAHDRDALDTAEGKFFEEAIQRRSRREPLQYITGRQEFWGLDFLVTPDVLIPRPETELLVESAARFAREAGRNIAVIDICTGSGCVAVSLARELAGARIFACDVSAQALAVARENARLNGVSDRIRFLEGDLFEPCEELDIRGGIDMITANPPYIPAGDLQTLQPEVRDYEPGTALIGGPAGTEIQKRILALAHGFLKNHGVLIMEMGMGQAAELRKTADNAGSYESIEILKDLAGIDRVIVARKR